MKKSISEAEFRETSIKIVKVLAKRSKIYDKEGIIRYVYNEAIEDAINFVNEMAKHNITYKAAYLLLEKEMKHFLPLIDV